MFPSFVLHYGGKYTANILQKPNQNVCFTICFGDFVAIVLQSENVAFYIGNDFGIVETDAALVVEIETSKIHVCAADHTKIII